MGQSISVPFIVRTLKWSNSVLTIPIITMYKRGSKVYAEELSRLDLAFRLRDQYVCSPSERTNFLLIENVSSSCPIRPESKFCYTTGTPKRDQEAAWFRSTGRICSVTQTSIPLWPWWRWVRFIFFFSLSLSFPLVCVCL
jgi:hypothetical protein